MRYSGKKEKCWQVIRQICKARSKDCYTCPAKDLEGINAQAGHCWPVGWVGSNNTLSWDFRQIRLQCSYCNGAGQGMQAEFKRHLEADLGVQEVLELQSRTRKSDPVRNWDVLFESLQAELSTLSS